MTQEEKELLLRDLCARLPYKPIIQFDGENYDLLALENCEPILARIIARDYKYSTAESKPLEDIKPYLRPMSSMTEEERKELEKITYHTFEYKKGERDIWTKSYHKNYLFDGAGELYGAGEPINMLCSSELCTKLIDWLNMHHFDYRHLIERGLALKAKEGMYKK